MKLTKDEQTTLSEFMSLPLVQGEHRYVYKCKECKKISAHDFIPYGLGQGRWYDMCLCNATQSNWRSEVIAKRTK